MSEPVVCLRVDLGRGPLQMDTSITRYGIEQRCLHPVGDDPTGWHGGWPSKTRLAWAEDDLAWYRAGAGDEYEFRIVTYPPEPPPWARRWEIA